MIALTDYIFEANSVELTDVKDIASWISEHNAFRVTVDPKDITIKNDKVDILPKERITIVVKDGVIPFKIGKLNGYLAIEWCDFVGDHLVDECGGISFTGVGNCRGLKNLTIKISTEYQEPNRSSNCIDFWKSSRALNTMRNITFEFDDPSIEVRVDRVTKSMLKSFKNIKLVNCDTIRSNSEAKVTVDDLKGFTDVKHIASNSGHIDTYSFDLIDGKWHTREELNK